jgi:tRNA (Thr-GGU) A37 N-methylase
MGNKDFPLQGVFATHSPARPNSILITVVKLVKREQNILHVTGLDALDGSPVLDIKPYVPYQDIKDIKVSGWMKEINREFSESV